MITSKSFNVIICKISFTTLLPLVRKEHINLFRRILLGFLIARSMYPYLKYGTIIIKSYHVVDVNEMLKQKSQRILTILVLTHVIQRVFTFKSELLFRQFARSITSSNIACPSISHFKRNFDSRCLFKCTNHFKNTYPCKV